MTEKLAVHQAAGSTPEWLVSRGKKRTALFYDEADAHKFAAVDGLIEAAERRLRHPCFYCRRERDCPDCMADKAALAAVCVPETA